MKPRERRVHSNMRRPALGVLAALLGAAGMVQAQTTYISPSLDTRLMWTDNVGVTSDNEKSDWVMEVSPGISVLRQSGRLKGRFNAQVRNFAYADQSERNTTYVSLLGNGEFEAVEKFLFLEADARVSRGNMSTLRGRPEDDVLNTDKNNETRLWSIGPRMQFRLGDSAEGLVRYQSRWYSGGSNTFGDQRIDRWTAKITDPAAFRLFGWQADYQRTDTEYDNKAYRALSEEIARGTLFINLTPQFRLRAIAGYESNDYTKARGENGEFFGGGFDWRPGERTRVSAVAEDRMQGRTYDVHFNHRMPRVAWDLRFANDITSPDQVLAARYDEDPLFQVILNNPGLVSEYPDPLERDNAARRLYDAAYGPDSLLTSAYYLERSAVARVSFFGVRNVVSLALQRRNRSPLSPTGDASADDLAGFRNVDTRSSSLTLNHRLSGLSALIASYTYSKSEGHGSNALHTKRHSAAIGIATRLGPHTTGGLSFRHQRAEGASDYTENAVIANLGMRF